MAVLGTDSYLGRPKRKMFFAAFVGDGTVMVIFWEIARFLHMFAFGSTLSLHPCFLVTAVCGCVVSRGTVGCLYSLHAEYTLLPPWAIAVADRIDAALEKASDAYPVHSGVGTLRILLT